MSSDFEKRIERLEAVQDRVLSKLEELHVEFVTLSSKVGNGLTTSTQNHALEIEKLKASLKQLNDQTTLRSKELEVDYVKLASSLDLLEGNLLKDLDQIKRGIALEIRSEGSAFIQAVNKHREDERVERAQMDHDRRSEIAKLASERKLYIVLGAVAVTLGAPLIMKTIDNLLSSL